MTSACSSSVPTRTLCQGWDTIVHLPCHTAAGLLIFSSGNGLTIERGLQACYLGGQGFGDWLKRADGGNNFSVGQESLIWRDSRENSEFISLFPYHREADAFTSLLIGPLLDQYHSLWGYKNMKVCTHIVDILLCKLTLLTESRYSTLPRRYSKVLPTGVSEDEQGSWGSSFLFASDFNSTDPLLRQSDDCSN